MKKLLFVVAVATIGLTTSCKKACDTCSVKTTQSGKTLSEVDINDATQCATLKANAGTNSVTINGTVTTSTTEVTCK
jgi:hypothetical protein